MAQSPSIPETVLSTSFGFFLILIGWSWFLTKDSGEIHFQEITCLINTHSMLISKWQHDYLIILVWEFFPSELWDYCLMYFFFFSCNIVDFQCCLSFRSTAMYTWNMTQLHIPILLTKLAFFIFLLLLPNASSSSTIPFGILLYLHQSCPVRLPLPVKSRCFGVWSLRCNLKIWGAYWGPSPLLLREKLRFWAHSWLWVGIPGVGVVTRLYLSLSYWPQCGFSALVCPMCMSCSF